MRKFKVNNYIKGELKRLGIHYNKLTFTSPSRNIQILEFDTDDFDIMTLNYLYEILGINEYGLYRELHLCREVLEGDIEGYTRMKKIHKTKETRKAVMIAGCWIPKSQIIEKDNYIYVKDWIFEQNVPFFNFK